MKTQPLQHISNKYNTCTIVTSPVYIGYKIITIIKKNSGYWTIVIIVLDMIFRVYKSYKNIIVKNSGY